MRRLLLAIMALALPACTGTESGLTTGAVETAGPEPTAYRQIALEHFKRTMFDPYSVREAQIARPKVGTAHKVGTLAHPAGWIICARLNAKNRMGGYTGVRDTLLLVKNGNVLLTQDDPVHYDVRTNCADAQYEPFPELEVQT